MLLLYNGKLLSRLNTASALAIENDRIIAVGSDDEVLNLYHPAIEKLDLGGRFVLPGLTDSHIHLDLYGQSLRMVNCAAFTKQECLERVREASLQVPAGEWITGHGWNQNLWDGGYGTAEELDALITGHPVFLSDISLHSAWVNSRALELAEISSSTPDPAGGIIQRNSTGNPTGILLEEAVNLVEKVIPPLSLLKRKQNLLAAQDRLLRYGVTSVHDFDRIPCLSALQEMEQEGNLILRVVKSLPIEQLNEAVSLGLHTGFGGLHLRIGSVKMFADGALGPQTAAMLAPYEGNPVNRGKLLLTADEVFETGILAGQSGLSLAIHAIGDRATSEVLNGLSMLRTYEVQNRLPLLPHRIEHLQLLHPESLEISALLGLCASMQPVHLYADMQTADRHWGARCRYAFPFASVYSRGTLLIFGSDAPVETPNPFWGIHAAVTRKNQSSEHSQPPWYPQECLSVGDAIQCYTVNPVRQAGMETTLGKIKEGYLADLLVLDQNPFTVPPDQLYSLRPEMVMVDGRWVYSTG